MDTKDKGGDAHRVEGKGVDGPDVINVVNRLAMALERVFLVLDLGAWVEIFNRNPAFDRRSCVSCNMLSRDVNITEPITYPDRQPYMRALSSYT